MRYLKFLTDNIFLVAVVVIIICAIFAPTKPQTPTDNKIVEPFKNELED